MSNKNKSVEMDKKRVEQIKQMRQMDDWQLIDFYESLAVATHHARFTAKFDDYDYHYPILQYTREEIGRRLSERHRRPANRGFRF